MSNTKEDISLEEFLSFFPNVELPVVLSEESVKTFSKLNKVLPPIAIHKFLLGENEEIDEYLEFVPCLSFHVSKDVNALVYWKAALLSYEFYLLTFNKSGEFLHSKVIAGIISNGEAVIRSAATINQDLIIHIMTSGQTDNNNSIESKPFHMEIMPDGSILSFKEEEN